MNIPSSTAPATPAALPRPTRGARANATDPDTRPMRPTHSANPMPDSSEICVSELGIAEHGAGDPRGDREECHRDGEHGDVGGQLLERDPPLPERRGRDDVEAAPPGLAGEGPGQGEDRPQPSEEGEEWPVLVRQEAAHRLGLDDRPGDARHDRRDVLEEPGDLRARLERPVGGAPGRADREHQPRDQPGEHDEREARVAEGLAVDAAEPVDPATERDRREGRRGPARRAGTSGHDRSPRRPRGRTGRGTSPRARARGRRSRAARSWRRPGRPA